jgi:predicted ATPase
MIKQFRVQNYKALRDVRLDLTPIHVLIGPNDSGKTSLLEAIAVLCRSVEFDLTQAFTGPWEGRALVWQKNPALDVVLGAAIEDLGSTVDYQFACGFAEKGRNAFLESEQVTINGKAMTLGSVGQALTTIKHIDNGGRVKDPDIEAAAKTVRHALAGVHYYRWNPGLMALPVAPDSKRRFRMDESGFGLALVLDDILGFDRKRFARIEDRFKQIFPQVNSIKLIPEMAYRAPVDSARPIPMLQQSEGKGLYFEFKESIALVSASQVSDGLLLVLGYLTLLHLPDPPRLILIEEPENGIHPKRIQEVLTILRTLVAEQNRCQVVLTTHSPYVLDFFKPEDVSLCRKGHDDAVAVHSLADSKTIRDQLDVFTLGEIWTAEGEEKIIRASQPPAGAVP